MSIDKIAMGLRERLGRSLDSEPGLHRSIDIWTEKAKQVWTTEHDGSPQQLDWIIFRERCRWCGSQQYQLSSLGPGICKRCANAAEIIGKDMNASDPTYAALLRKIRAAADSISPQAWKEPFGSYRERIVGAMRAANQPPTALKLAPAEPEPIMWQAAKLEAERRRVAKLQRR